MRYNRVIVAKVALNVASEDNLFHFEKCQNEHPICNENVAELSKLAEVPATAFCIDTVTLIEAGDTNDISRLDQDHMAGCDRCGKIGQYISSMPSDRDEEAVPSMASANLHMSLSA